LTQTETAQIKVQIDANGMHYEAGGSVEEIMPQVIQFLSQVVPTYNLARKLIYVPDLARLTDKISDVAKMTSTGKPLLTRADLAADRAVSIVLFMAHLLGKLGKRDNESLSVEEISDAVGKASKTIRNAIVQLQKLGLIERVERGNYCITTKGVMQLENSLLSTDEKRGAA
jgi:predicted transcriptional regulator